MSRDHAATARACFAMAARAELAEGQRAAAVNRGMAIVEKYALDPDSFDIPGRERKARPINGKRPTVVMLDEFAEFGDLSFFERVIREERERASRSINDALAAMMHRQMAEDLFRKTQRAEQMKVRTDAQILGGERGRIFRNDGC